MRRSELGVKIAKSSKGEANLEAEAKLNSLIPQRGCIVSRKKQRSESRLQLSIMEKYGEQVSEAKLRLCTNCAFFNSRQCQNLCPITSDGGDCPYFSQSKVVVSGSALSDQTR